jgi:SAM-dependent methyltransferase
MVRSVRHDMLPRPTHDEAARQQFVVALKQHLNRQLRARNRELFEQAAAPRFQAERGRAPVSRDDIRTAMSAQPAYRAWSALARSAQELMWRSVLETIARERPRFRERLQRLGADAATRGSLELDPTFVPPRGVASIDIHLQPGGYTLDLGDDDVTAGALYEAGGNLYAFGQGISRTDSKAAAVQGFLRERYPDLTPKDILDMGCSAGSATVPYAQAFPSAEVHGIDVGSGMLRYAHARAEALGQPVHFHQRDAGDTRFPSASFDLVVSHNLMHEVPSATRVAMLAESWRLLRPGGVFIHQDIPLQFAGLDEYQKFDYSWDTRNNNEPYWEAYANADLAADLARAGVPAAHAETGNLPRANGSLPWFIVAGRKPAR